MRRLVFIALMAAACAQAARTDRGTPADSVVAEPFGTVRVDNRAFNDMTIYVIEPSGARSRIGTATGNSITTLRIPSRLLGGTRTLRFQADPIGGRDTPISDEVTIVPGEVVTLTIPPG